jgi:divergent AAA domain protein
MRIENIQRMAHDILEKGSIENDYIEYKKSATFKNKILKTVCAFANNYMNREIGLLFIGVEEVNDPKTEEKAIPQRPICGVEESLIESTENSLKQLLANIHPKVSYHLITDIIDDRNYIIVAVEPGTSGPYQTSDKAENDKDISLKAGRYIRVRRDSRLPNFKEEYELLRKFAHDVFSSNLNETATLDDLNYEYIKEYLIATNAREDIRNQSKLDMAKSMGLISESEYGGYRAKNFAVLMFAERPDKFIPYAHVEIIREAIGTDKMEAKVFDGPIWLQAKQVSRYFKDNIMASYTVRDSETIEHRIVYNWPLTAFEELATNCILHKQYESPNYIGIYIYNDRITFVNHNRPVPPVTIEAMNKETRFDDRQYLNPELKEMFFALDLIESYGSGIRRAKEALIENHSPELQFLPDNDTDDYTMAVVMINEEFAAIREEEQKKSDFTKENAKENAKEMTKEIAKEIKNIMKENPFVNAEDLAEELNVSATKVRYHIRAMKKNGEIQRVGSTKAGTWEILK